MKAFVITKKKHLKKMRKYKKYFSCSFLICIFEAAQ